MYGFPIKGDSLRVEVLLNNKMLSNINLNSNFINSIDITSKKLILLSTTTQFYLLGWGIVNPICHKVTGNISSFAYTHDNLLMVIRNNELCSFDSTENLFKFIKLPRPGMGISAGKYVMYIYDRNEKQTKHSLYIIAHGGQFKKLFDSPAPIQSVCEMDNSILFATENVMFNFNPGNKHLKPIAVLTKDKVIKSITVDSSGNNVYFSTDKSVYALIDTNIVTVTNEFGGILKYFNHGLLILNPEKKLLIRMAGIDEKITSEAEILEAAAREKQTKGISSKTENVPPVNQETEKPTLTKTELPVQPAVVPMQESLKQPEPATSGTTAKEIHLPANCIRVEKFISNTSGSLEKGKTYILKKDFSQPIDFLNNFPDGSILKLVGSVPGEVKSWKVVKPSDGSYALIDSKLYTYFEQAHVWLPK
jgi:hypothetical protein